MWACPLPGVACRVKLDRQMPFDAADHSNLLFWDDL